MQNDVKNILNIFSSKKLSKKINLDERISKFKKVTEKTIKLSWNKNLFFGDTKIFVSEKIPIRKA